MQYSLLTKGSVILALMSVFMVQNTVVAQSNVVDIKKAIAIIKAHEAKFKSFQYETEISLWSGDGKKIRHQGHALVRIAFDQGFYLEKRELMPWTDGRKNFSFQKTISSFDGQVSRVEAHQCGVDTNDLDALEKNHRSLLEKMVGEGSISKGYGTSVSTVNWRGIPECIGYVYPFVGAWNETAISKYYPPISLSQTLSTLVSKKNDLQVIEDKVGVWHIFYPFMILENTGDTLYVRIDYDPGKGLAGAIHSVQVGTRSIVDNYSIEPNMSFALTNINDYYVPEIITILYDYGKNGGHNVYQRIHFTKFQVNLPFSESDFQINWQKGTNVYDQVTKKFYVVTGDPIDEAEAVRAFKDIHGLSRHSVLGDNARIIFLRIVLMVAGLALMAYGIYLRFKKNIP